MQKLINVLTTFCSNNDLRFTYGFSADIDITPEAGPFLFLQLPLNETIQSGKATVSGSLSILGPAQYEDSNDLNLPMYDYLSGKVTALYNTLYNQFAAVSVTRLALERGTNSDTIGYVVEFNYVDTVC